MCHIGKTHFHIRVGAPGAHTFLVHELFPASLPGLAGHGSHALHGDISEHVSPSLVAMLRRNQEGHLGKTEEHENQDGQDKCEFNERLPAFHYVVTVTASVASTESSR